MRPTDRNAIAVVAAVGLATLTALPLTADRSFLLLSWVGIATIGLLGALLRRARVGAAGVAAGQLLALVVGTLVLTVFLSGSTSVFEQYPQLWFEGIDHMQTSSSPMTANPGVTLIFVTVVGLVALVTDLLVSGLERPAWSIAPLATLFAVPALGLDLDTGLFSFGCVAVGYLLILLAGGLNSAAAWTRGLSYDAWQRSQATGGPIASRGGTTGPVVWRAAAFLALPALVLTAVMGLLLPTVTLPGWGWGNATGANGPLQLTDPSLDLRRNLNQPADRVVFRYTTDQPGGVYLRMASLPQFSSAGFSNVQIRLNEGNRLPDVPGYTGATPAVRTTKISVEGFSSQYLPLPYAPRSFDADGTWSSNANSLIVVDSDNRTNALRNLTYDVQSWDIAPTAAQLSEAAAGTPSDDEITGAVPDDLPRSLVDLSLRVTEDADTPAAKAAAIQAFLRSSEFTYSTDPQPGSGYQALVNFLLNDRTGYCEQFAAAMAMMARVNGIPSRVAVGFLPGESNGNSYDVYVRQMHAWPELYFQGWGWIRFEPTPSQVTGSAPAWTVQNAQPSAAPTAEPSVAPSSAAPSTSSAPSQAPDQAPVDTTTDTGSRISARTVLVGLGALLGLLVLAAPATLRVRRRQSRLGSDGPADAQVESAWAEIRDSVLDYGGSWPTGSPRQIGAEVGSRLESPDAATVGRVATLVERSRYARSLEADAETRDLPAMTEDIRRALAQPTGPVRKALAFLAPRSLWANRRRSV